MRNHVKNRLRINGEKERIKELVEYVHSAISHFDLNKIIQRPESLNIENLSVIDYGIQYLNAKSKIFGFPTAEEQKIISMVESWPEEQRKKCIEDGRQAINNTAIYGYPTWLQWNIAKWGTKWNTYEDSYNEQTNCFEFQTANDTPIPCIEELSKQYPELEFTLEYADEDLGRRCGRIFFKNGEIILTCQPSTWSKEAFDLGFSLWPEDKKYYKLVNGNYEYIDDEN